MSLSCSTDYDYDDYDWWLEWTRKEIQLPTKRGRKCCSCKSKINPGDVCSPLFRYRRPNDEIEERIYGDEVSLSNWYLCEKCNDLALSLDELGYCFELNGESIQKQIDEYRKEGGKL